MSGDRMLIGTLAVLALLFFWMLGAYNRVIGLRLPILQAWVQVESALQARREAVTALLTAAAQPLVAERAALDAAAAALAQLGQAVDAVRPRPATAAAALAELARAEAALAPPLARLVALIENLPGWREDAALAAPLRTLQELAPRWQFARQVFNEAAATYDAAVREYPTRLLAGVFRFGRAGQL